jgi:hypothetical protein
VLNMIDRMRLSEIKKHNIITEKEEKAGRLKE